MWNEGAVREDRRPSSYFLFGRGTRPAGYPLPPPDRGIGGVPVMRTGFGVGLHAAGASVRETALVTVGRMGASSSPGSPPTGPVPDPSLLDG